MDTIFQDIYCNPLSLPANPINPIKVPALYIPAYASFAQSISAGVTNTWIKNISSFGCGIVVNNNSIIEDSKIETDYSNWIFNGGILVSNLPTDYSVSPQPLNPTNNCLIRGCNIVNVANGIGDGSGGFIPNGTYSYPTPEYATAYPVALYQNISAGIIMTDPDSPGAPSGSVANVIENNIIQNVSNINGNGYGILVVNQQGAIIRNNIVSYNTNGIWSITDLSVSTSLPSLSNTYENNIISFNTNYGIYDGTNQTSNGNLYLANQARNNGTNYSGLPPVNPITTIPMSNPTPVKINYLDNLDIQS